MRPAPTPPTSAALSAVAAALSIALPMSRAQDAAESGALDTAVERAAAYLEAWESRDAVALGALFAQDAYYTVDGEAISGRAAITERSKTYFAENPEATLELGVESATFLTPDVLVERGFASVRSGGGAEESLTRYSATHVRRDGSWLISEVTESSLAPASEGAEAMSSLAWMIGKWQTKDESIGAETEAIWVLEGNFISRTTTVTRDDGSQFVSVELLGYDPGEGRLRSWVFDNEGGFGEGHWRQDGDKWLVSIRATAPDGSQSSAEHVLTQTGDGAMALDTINRVLDGEVLPSRERIEIVRVGDGAGSE